MCITAKSARTKKIRVDRINVAAQPPIMSCVLPNSTLKRSLIWRVSMPRRRRWFEREDMARWDFAK